ncbi:MAG: peptidylprolyl isomerase [Vicinamibacteria bacterium]
MKLPISSSRSTSRLLVLLAAAASFAPGCRRAPAAAPAADPEQVVATWAGGVIKRSEIETPYANSLASEPGATPERRAELFRLSLERRARIELLHREAVAEGLPERPDIKAVLRAQTERLLADDWLQSHAAANAKAADAQVEAEVARRTAAPVQETRRFAHVFLRAAAGDAAARAQAAEKMARLRKELSEGAAFDEVARKYSDSITARAGGQVEWTTKAVLHPKAAAVVFAMAEGQVSEVVETEAGLQIFRLDGIRQAPAVDLSAVRAEVRRAQDAEAGRAAAQAERQRVWDDAALHLDARALERPGKPGDVVVTVAGEPLTRADLEHVRAAWKIWAAADTAPPLPELVRVVVVNRLLAARRHEAPLDAALQRRLDSASRNVVVDARRLELVGTLDLGVTPAEIEAFYAQHKESAPFLRDHVVDVLFFPQKGDSAAEVYALGEVVSRELRDGATFDRVLASRAGRAVVARRLPMTDLDTVRGQSTRIYKALGQLRPGEVSAPLYIEGDRVSFTSAPPTAPQRGLVFVRLVEVRPLPLASARKRIHDAVVGQKRSEGVMAVQAALNQRTQLKVLVDRL